MKNFLYIRHFVFLIVIQIIISLIIVFLNNYMPPEIPLFYGKPEGPEQIATYYNMFILPATIFSSSIISFLLIKYILKDEFLHKTLIGTLYVITLLEVITITKIFFLIS